jgi:hypothetical protein
VCRVMRESVVGVEDCRGPGIKHLMVQFVEPSVQGRSDHRRQFGLLGSPVSCRTMARRSGINE